jgi:hypothetical protein
MAELRQSFQEFIFSTNTDGSGKAASYVRTLVRDNGFPEIANQWKDAAE